MELSVSVSMRIQLDFTMRLLTIQTLIDLFWLCKKRRKLMLRSQIKSYELPK